MGLWQRFLKAALIYSTSILSDKASWHDALYHASAAMLAAPLIAHAQGGSAYRKRLEPTKLITHIKPLGKTFRSVR